MKFSYFKFFYIFKNIERSTRSEGKFFLMKGGNKKEGEGAGGCWLCKVGGRGWGGGEGVKLKELALSLISPNMYQKICARMCVRACVCVCVTRFHLFTH